MHANICGFYDQILAASNVRYLIPVYQRNYSWREEECKMLISDILKVYNKTYADHFIGTVVIKPEDGNSSMLNVIDGQQRITTMFLLCKAILDTTSDDSIKARMNNILFDQYNNEPRLVPIKSDNEVFVNIINNNMDLITNHSSRIYQNYKYFKNQLEEQQLDSNQLLMVLRDLKAIRMELQYNDNPQVIFESINSTGLSLSIADLIRNFLLMNEDYDTQIELFNNYWAKFELKLGVDNLVMFFEHFLNIKIRNKAITRSDMYNMFKGFYTGENYDARTLLSDVDIFVDCYKYLVNKDMSYSLNDIKLNDKFNMIKNEIIDLKNNVSNMFLMQVLVNHSSNILTDEELIYSFELVLSYIFRRNVVALPSNSMQKVFRYLYSQVNEHLELGYTSALNYALVTSKANTGGRFVTNNEFYDALCTRNLYGKLSSLDYLLSKLENEGNKTLIADLTIEHVLPQTLTTYWKEALGSDYKTLHADYVHDLGNLTLTSYNSDMSNFDFEKKKSILDDESHIKLNKYFNNINTWNDVEIAKRSEILASRALNIWLYPEIDMEIEKQIEDSKYTTYTLTDLLDEFIPGLRVVGFKIEDKEYNIKGYANAVYETALYAMSIDKEKFYDTFVDSEEYCTGKYYIASRNKDLVYNNSQIGDIYFESGGSGYGAIRKIKMVLEEYNIAMDNVVIKVYK